MHHLKVRKVGNSLSVTLPKEAVNRPGFPGGSDL
jgi:antitoxin component of MazEF toxin-antitoxin module